MSDDQGRFFRHIQPSSLLLDIIRFIIFFIKKPLYINLFCFISALYNVQKKLDKQNLKGYYFIKYFILYFAREGLQ